jgi:putative adhesin
MSMPGDQPSPFRRFLSTWRREIIRGGVLFGLVVTAGLMISRVRVGFGLPWAALRSFGNFDIDPEADLFGPGREVGDPWQWKGRVTVTQQVWIRNTNGPVAVVQGNGDVLEVTAEKSWRNSQPDAVELVPVTSERGVTICALWAAHERRCGEGGEYQLNGVQKNDVAVRFTVHLPRGVRIDVSTANGEVAIEGAAAPVVANTLNGRVLVHTSVGPVKASTLNGSIEAAMDALTGGDIELETKNGSITAMLPGSLNAVVDASTMNGRVETDFPLQLSGKISPRHVRGTIGSGGMTLRLRTVYGSVTIRRADGRSADVTPEAPVAPPPRAPHPPRARRAAPTPRP